MKIDKIIWGIILVFIGGVVLLDNFDVIDFYWRRAWAFWPIVLIILGSNMLFNRNGKQTGSYISLVVLLISLCVLFVRGQEPPQRKAETLDAEMFDNQDGEDDRDKKISHLSAPFDDSVKVVDLNVRGGGASYELKGATDSLFTATIEGVKSSYMLQRNDKDSVSTLDFQLGKGKNNFHLSDAGHDVAIYLNKKPIHNINFNVGAGEVKFDLTDYKVRTIDFNGGAAEMDITLGSLLPIADVNVKTGIADIKINVPESAGCQIRAKTGLSSKDFDGFDKKSDNLYQTANFSTAKSKIFINFDGGLSSFEVNRY